MLNRVVMIDGKIYDIHELRLVTFDIPNNSVLLTVMSTYSGTGEITERANRFPLRDDLTIAQWESLCWASEFYVEWRDESSELLDDILSVLTDEQAEQFPQAFLEWETGCQYAVGDRRRYNDKLYRCIQAHTSQDGWEPSNTPALWVRTAPDGEIPEWIQPTGSQDAYNTGDKVKHNLKTWISTVDGNVWEPGVYGWNELV